MNYADTINKAEDILNSLLTGSSLTDLEEKLAKEVEYQYQVDKIISKSKSFLSDKLGKDFEKALLQNDQYKIQSYGLHPQTLDWLKQKCIDNIRSYVNSQIYLRLKVNEPIEAIAKDLANSFYPENEILDKINTESERERDQIEQSSKTDRKTKMNLGIGLLILGFVKIALSLVLSFDFLLTLGIINIVGGIIHLLMVPQTNDD